MRHIPEDELHAYLDQGLSRSQAVEIESHLAGCFSCRANRDAIAALRDRTTALLATLAPPRRVPPAFDTLRHRAADRITTRRRLARVGAWAASLVAAVGLGWTASTLVGPGREGSLAQREARPSAPAAAPRPAASVAVSDTAVSQPSAPAPQASRVASRAVESTPVRFDGRRSSAAASAAKRKLREDSVRAARLALLDPAPAPELTPLEEQAAGEGEQFDGVWRTMSWDGAQSEAGRGVPHIDGLPVLRVQVQATNQGSRPLMVVAQQLASGQVIQTIEGPAADVSQLLSRRTGTSADGKLAVSITEATPGADQAMAMQLGDRMLAITGALPSDSLRALIRRINAEMRSK